MLTVTPTEGEVMTGFDIAVIDPNENHFFVSGGAPIFQSGKNGDTSFLLDESHMDGPPPGITDLTVAADFESD